MTHTHADRDQQIAAMLRAGATYLDITTKLRVANSTIRAVRDALDIPVPPGRAGARPITPEQRRTSAEQRHPKAAAMLRAGFTHRDIADACGIGIGTVSAIRTALGIPTPTGPRGGRNPRPNLAEERRPLDDAIAHLLAAGRTYDQICAELRVGSTRITRVQRERRITLAPTRAKRTRPELTAATNQAAAMLRAGATVSQIRTATRLNPNAIADLRRTLALPVPKRPDTSPTLTDALARWTQPHGDGHARWTGPHAATIPYAPVANRRILIRRHLFHAHHQREPVGYIKTNCSEPACIAAPHLTDRLIRDANKRADQAFEQIFGGAL